MQTTLYKTIMKYILITLIFFACKNNSGQKNYPGISTEVLDTITSAPARIVANPSLFETAFIKGTKQKVKDSNFNLYGITIGKLRVVSGHIIACDPLHIDEYGIPFTQVFPTGEFPVQLSIAELGNEEMIAFGRINFSDEPVVKWEFALQEGQQPLPVGGEEMHGYGVDAGIVVFFDKEANKALDEEKLTNMDADLYKEMGKHNHDLWKYAMYNVAGHSMAAFTTGLGDGRYATYIGFDAKGAPCRLVTDFGLFDWKNK
ncbi:MAG: hypothetical protein JWR72_667 [Flavisolibacter sp.]|nr:hypothetical protein [Flavisolibacter sp.]